MENENGETENAGEKIGKGEFENGGRSAVAGGRC